MAKKERWTECRVAALIANLYPAGAYAYLTAVRNGTGYQRRQNRTADALAVSCWPSRGLYLVGFEIKVSRSDWRKELASPAKSVSIQNFCRYWYIAAPKGVVPVGEVPENWGLIECERSANIVREAPKLEEKPLDMLMMCSILRRVGETTVPLDELNSRVKQNVDAVREAAAASHLHELETLRQTIASFEDASGVSLSKHPWEAGRIGEAVKIIREHGTEAALAVTRKMAREHGTIATRLNEMLSELNLPTEKCSEPSM